MTTSATPRAAASRNGNSIPPARTIEQRMDALARANRIRSYRAELKKALKRGDRELADVILTAADPFLGGDLRLETMAVHDLLLAAPKIGKTKARTILQTARVSPSKTLGGLTQRQRLELATLARRPSRRAR